MVRGAARPLGFAALGAAVALAVVAVVLEGVLPADGTSPDDGTRPGEVDVGFAQDMAVHHDQAVQMAALGRQHGSPRVRALSASIEVGQSREIGTLRGWLALWDEPQLPRGTALSWAQEHGAGGDPDGTGHAMPGMATTTELADLAALRDREFDRRFLELMIRHHEAGVRMAAEAAQRAEVPQVRSLASAMVVGQTDELAEMSGLLVALESGD